MGESLFEKHAKSFFSTSLDLICIAGTDGYFKELNPAWTKLLGWSLEELCSQPYLNFIHPDDLQPTIEKAAALASGANVVRFENRYRHKEGGYRWLEWNALVDLEQQLIQAVVRDVTEIRRKIILADEAEEITRVGTWEFDLDTSEVRWSRVTHEIHETDYFSYRPQLDEALSFFPDSARQELSRRFELLTSNGIPYDLELPFITHKGRHIWVRATGNCRLLNGKVARLFGTFQEVTRQRREREELLRFKEIVEIAQEGIWEVDSQGITTYVNARMGEILGVTTDELLGRNFLDFIPKEEHQVAGERFRERKSGKADFYEVRVRHTSGREVWCLVSATPRLDAERKMISAIALVSDITRLKQTEFELRKREQHLKDLASRLELALRASQMGVWSIDSASGTITWDKRTSEIYGPSATNGNGSILNWFRSVHKDDQDRTITAFMHSIQNAVPLDVTFRIVRADGEVRYLRAKADVTLDPQGATYLIGVNQDVTADIQLNEELRTKRIEAEAASNAKSHFLANMSHEIRTPLNGILGMAQLLALTPLNEEQKEFVATLNSSGRSLLGLIEDILDLSKIEAGVIDLHQEEFHLGAMIRSAAESVAGIAHQKNLQIVVKIPEELDASFLGDQRHARQVLMNLAGNAVKFTNSGSVTIEAKLLLPDDVLFRVTDTGPGIPLDQQEAIFERFAVADASHTRPHGGSGLGLAIAKSLVVLAKGSIGVESKPGSGSTFWFRFPLKRIGEGSSIAPKLESEAFINTRHTGPARLVLLAEDSIVNQMVIAKLIRKIGFEVDVAGNGEEALLALAQKPYDLILMDVQMPVLDGFEATRQIRAAEAALSSGPNNPVSFHPEQQHPIPIVAMTALALRGDEERCLKAGMSGYLTKPVSLHSLSKVLKGIEKKASGID